MPVTPVNRALARNNCNRGSRVLPSITTERKPDNPRRTGAGSAENRAGETRLPTRSTGNGNLMGLMTTDGIA
ncbi:hypothetical protein MMUR_46430 [Mycolicibacterium murale]|uniref:Uncharacterized protein n=1 Tax=Mycolicibacterium murale TaxID=182220 RepID=A0A7I9WTH4_9MYCO|nr:hypothetical protein MTOK_39750 [Mycolicibacterium tokaiense]GFG60507.1 hypothetical protein MMUR_46430 [Mycolicibacterium murale]